jgi:hypothetical protein
MPREGLISKITFSQGSEEVKEEVHVHVRGKVFQVSYNGPEVEILLVSSEKI